MWGRWITDQIRIAGYADDLVGATDVIASMYISEL
jgi:hypothetical protein